MGRLTTIAIKAAKTPEDRPIKLSDGKGLYLLLTPAGGRLWRFDYRIAGKRKTMALGAWPHVGLSDARKAHEDAHGKVRAGVDPAKDDASGQTFKQIADAWWSSRKDSWTTHYANTIKGRLDRDIYPAIGETVIGDVKSGDVLDALRAIQGRGALEAGRRMRAVVSEVFDFAKAEGAVADNPVEKLGKALKSIPPRTRRSALKMVEMSEFFRRLEVTPLEEQTRDALLLTILTAVRTKESLGAEIPEFEQLNGSEPMWRIPASRMKMKREHLVPLSPQAVAVVKRLKGDRKVGLLIPRGTKSGSLSLNTMLYALYRMGYHKQATVHGFRGTFSTAANEAGWNSEWVERQLAHIEQNEVRGAYNAAEYLPGRRKLLQWWADTLDTHAMIGDLLG